MPASPSKAQVYSRSILRLKETIPGARMWGVSLEQTQLTYFEVQPHCRFALHHHPSEQITFVLTGTLYFEVDDEVVAVGPGEVMALPANYPHAAFTRAESVTAVDAWSPVMAQYRD